jgi:hypothetical protein
LVNLIKPTRLTRNERYTEGIIYENTHLDVGAGAVRINWLRGRNAAAGYNDDQNDDYARGDYRRSRDWSRYARGGGATSAANGAN